MRISDRRQEQRDLGTMIAGCRDRAEDLRMNFVAYLLDIALITMERALSGSPTSRHLQSHATSRANIEIDDGH